MIQQTPKKDKNARAELTEKLKKMEADMKKRHEDELKAYDQAAAEVFLLSIPSPRPLSHPLLSLFHSFSPPLVPSLH